MRTNAAKERDTQERLAREQATARLKAINADLLEALESIVQCAAYRTRVAGAAEADLAAIRGRARAAIARARGE